MRDRDQLANARQQRSRRAQLGLETDVCVPPTMAIDHLAVYENRG
jgi:hypothetical protein